MPNYRLLNESRFADGLDPAVAIDTINDSIRSALDSIASASTVIRMVWCLDPTNGAFPAILNSLAAAQNHLEQVQL